MVYTWAFYEDIDPRNSILFLSFLNLCASIYSCTVSILHIYKIQSNSILFSFFTDYQEILKVRMHNCLCLRFSQYFWIFFAKFAYIFSFQAYSGVADSAQFYSPFSVYLYFPVLSEKKIVSRKAASCLSCLISIFVSSLFLSLPSSLFPCLWSCF